MNQSHPILCLAEAQHRSDLYDRTVELRNRVLRDPLGLTFSVEEMEKEERDIHCAAFDRSGEVLACLVLSPLEKGEIRMRQVAVTPRLQGSGIGSLIVAWSEGIARREGFRRMILHARATAIPFYLRLDYRTTGPEFTEVTIPHRIMYRDL